MIKLSKCSSGNFHNISEIKYRDALAPGQMAEMLYDL